MTDRPILFSAPMIRAILREIKQPGTGKTQTRRIIKPVKSSLFTTMYPHYINGELAGSTSDPTFDDLTSENGGNPLFAGVTPYCPGDRLWVRESLERANEGAIGYPADGSWLPNTPWEWQRGGLPSIHMPRRLSRITLNVTDVRVQRLQEINEDDARAEGIQCSAIKCGDGVERVLWSGVPQAGHEWSNGQGPIQAFADLWDSINNPHGLCADDAPKGWEANPWIVAVTFRPVLVNVDAMEAPAA